MKLTWIVQELHRNSCGAQLRGITESIVADRIETGGNDHGRGQATQVRVERRREPWIHQVLALLDERSERIHEIGGHEMALPVLALRWEFGEQIGRRVDKHLQLKFRTATTQILLRHSSADIAAGAVAADGQARGFDSDRSPVFSDPAQRREKILGRRRGRVREPDDSARPRQRPEPRAPRCDKWRRSN